DRGAQRRAAAGRGRAAPRRRVRRRRLRARPGADPPRRGGHGVARRPAGVGEGPMVPPPHGTESLWLAAGRADGAAHPALEDDAEVDVAVVGGGIAGLTTALLLQRDGARVAVLDRGPIAGGASGATTAK